MLIHRGEFATVAILAGVLALGPALQAADQAPTQTSSPRLENIFQFNLFDGWNPFSGVVIGPGGVLYGTTFGGGPYAGNVFSLTPPSFPGASWTEVMYALPGGAGGSSPAGPLAGSKGVLYGTATAGGSSNAGVVFSVSLGPAGGPAAETVLYSFTGDSDGGCACYGVIIGRDGALYGTTKVGGSFGYGTVFSLTPPVNPGGAWTETVLHSFEGWDGAYPLGGLLMANAPDGPVVLYGTTSSGGRQFRPGKVVSPYGTVFSLTAPAIAPSDDWKETVLYSFSGLDGASPWASLVSDSSGVLYGTTPYGGTGNSGTVFSLTPPAANKPNEAWTQTVLYSFSGGSDGYEPFSGVILGKHGVLYGVTYQGGDLNSGTIFSLTPPAVPGGVWAKKTLHSFTGGSDGSSPLAAMALGEDGVLYGTTDFGSIYDCYGGGCGTVFAFVP